MQLPEPQDQHRWLLRLVGEWSSETNCSMGTDQPSVTIAGTMSTRPLGGLWILGEMVGGMPDGGEARSIITLGYDPQAGRFVGSFVSSCMTYFWSYQGSLDAAGKVLTLDAEGPSFSGDGSMAKYQDIIELVDQNEFRLGSQFLGPDGNWVRFMASVYRRRQATSQTSAS